MRVVSFTDFQPTPRYDGAPWATVEIREGATVNGPWTLIDTIVLVPLDADPSNPAVRSFTTDSAVLDDGWYSITFVDANGNDQLPVAPVHRGPETALMPTLAQIGTIALSRTADAMGNVLGTFTSDTRPTNASATRLMEKAAEDVIPEVGTDIPVDLQDKVRSLIALRTAMLIELTLYGAEIRNNISPYPNYKQLYDEELKKIQEEISAEEAGADPSDSLGTMNVPAWGFPAADDLMSRKM